MVHGDHQRFHGYTVFLCKLHAFQPEKLNYELLGTGKGLHMHWHIFTRQTGDAPTPGPVWQLGTQALHRETDRPDDAR